MMNMTEMIIECPSLCRSDTKYHVRGKNEHQYDAYIIYRARELFLLIYSMSELLAINSENTGTLIEMLGVQ